MADAIRAELPARHRSRLTNKPLAAVDKRTVRGRRIRDLVQSLIADLAEPVDAGIVAEAVEVAEITLAAETARRSPQPDPNSIVRLQRLCASMRAAFFAAYAAKPEDDYL
jgi:hypothetical protein